MDWAISQQLEKIAKAVNERGNSAFLNTEINEERLIEAFGYQIIRNVETTFWLVPQLTTSLDSQDVHCLRVLEREVVVSNSASEFELAVLSKNYLQKEYMGDGKSDAVRIEFTGGFI